MTRYASDIIPAICIVCGHHFPMDRHVVLACDGMVSCGCEVTGARPNPVDIDTTADCHTAIHVTTGDGRAHSSQPDSKGVDDDTRGT